MKYSFSEFLKNEESFFSGMNKIGIDQDDYKKFPQVASFYNLENPVNIGSFVILNYIKDKNGLITHVKIKQINDPVFKNLKYDRDNVEKLNNDNKDKEFIISVEDLEQLLIQGSMNSTQEPI